MSPTSSISGSGNAKSGYWLWEPEGAATALLVHLQVIEKIRQIVMAGFASLPRRGLETGGLLFGRVEQLASGRRLITVEGCEAFESEHVSGPSYVLSAADRHALQDRLDALDINDIVGWFRSQTRDGLAPDMADADLFQNFLGNGTILLLVKPHRGATAEARIYARENGEFADFGLESFPFSRKELDKGPVLSIEPAPATISAGIPAPEDAEAKPAKPNHRSRYWQWIWLPVALSVALIGVMLWQHRRPIPPATTVVQYGNPKLLKLSLERHGDSLRLVWNKDAPEVQTASNGVLLIDDGGVETRFDLDHSQLQGGAVAYHPNSQDVTFRMNVDSPSGHVASEPLHAWLQPLNEPAAGPPAALAQNQMRARRKPPLNPNNDDDDGKPSPAKPVQQAALPPVAEIHEQPVTAAAPPPAAEPAPRKAEPQPLVANVRVEPAPESGIRRGLQTIPVLRLLQRRRYKAGTNFAPPRAVLHMPPQLPAQAAAERKDLGVDLKLTIDEDGKLQRTEVLTPGADQKALNAAVASVRKWRFEPGRIGDRPVVSKVIAHFRF